MGTNYKNLQSEHQKIINVRLYVLNLFKFNFVLFNFKSNILI